MSDAFPMVRPLGFHCEKTLRVTRREIFEGLIQLENWKSFERYGPLPGIRKATFVHRNEGVTGSVIRVENTDGSEHHECVLEWLPEERAVIELSGFSPPLSALASRFIETWSFTEDGGSCRVRRNFELYPKNEFVRPFLWLISLLLRRAVGRHLKAIANGIRP